MLARRRVWQTPTLVALSELAVIGTPASSISRDQLAYANKPFLEMHAGNQRFFVTRPEIVRTMKDLAEVAKVVTRDILVLLDANPLEDVANVDRFRAVVTAGRFLDRPALDQLLAQAKAAAQR
jgi:hypothetical protein